MKNQYRLNRQQKGQALIEILVAMTIAILIISSISVAILTALNNAEHSKYQAEATQYAQEGMDNMKAVYQLQVSNYQSILNTPSSTYCMESVFEDDPGSPNGGCSGQFNSGSDPSTLCAKATPNFVGSGLKQCAEPSGTGIIFDRKIYIDPTWGAGNCDPSKSHEIDVVVSWADSKCTNINNAFCNNVTLTQCFANPPQ